MASIGEVALRAAVSVASVSRMINGSLPINEAPRRRILQAMSDLPYSPGAPTLGVTACQLLMERLDGYDGPPRRRYLPASLAIRLSCRAPLEAREPSPMPFRLPLPTSSRAPPPCPTRAPSAPAANPESRR